MDELKENKVEKSSLKFIILWGVLLIIVLIAIYFTSIHLMNIKYINFATIELDRNITIEDEKIAKIIKVDASKFKKFKDNFIGANIIIGAEEDNNDTSIKPNAEPNNLKKEEFKEQAENNFKILENFILNRDLSIYTKLRNALEDSNLYDNKVEETKTSNDILLNNFYANVCAGLLKYHFNFEQFNIEVNKIKKYNDTTMYITVNNRYLVIFEYNSSECYFLVYNGKKYNDNKKELIFNHLQGYNSLKSWYRIENMSIDVN